MKWKCHSTEEEIIWSFPIEAVGPTRTQIQFKVIIMNEATIFFFNKFWKHKRELNQFYQLLIITELIPAAKKGMGPGFSSEAAALAAL